MGASVIYREPLADCVACKSTPRLVRGVLFGGDNRV